MIELTEAETKALLEGHDASSSVVTHVDRVQATLESRVEATVASPSTGASTGFAWTVAFDRLPKLRRLLEHYPPLTEIRHEDFGRVLVAAFLSDRVARVHRNLKIDGTKFFEVPHLQTLVDMDEPEFRIVVRLFAYRVGARVQYWESHPGGDAPGKSVAVLLHQDGPRRLKGNG